MKAPDNILPDRYKNHPLPKSSLAAAWAGLNRSSAPPTCLTSPEAAGSHDRSPTFISAPGGGAPRTAVTLGQGLGQYSVSPVVSTTSTFPLCRLPRTGIPVRTAATYVCPRHSRDSTSPPPARRRAPAPGLPGPVLTFPGPVLGFPGLVLGFPGLVLGIPGVVLGFPGLETGCPGAAACSGAPLLR
eukprot:CAMPEP_0118954540 /NCGR_PEP_ID=MMETSP1169-20130426/58421_1 /TAXON_ID=36882 /ORGANISM="Pyramimonas obovata, Strain CCMP722" /LENGTH=185 /DNA_ID=CAMNT_0006902191 /DNA_START=36 /DNA_END=590 /DNA_ORIENTATION=-